MAAGGVRRNDPASGSTICTRAPFTPFMAWMVRAISPSSAREPRDLLHEGGEAHGAHLVEQLVAGVGARRQALLRQQHARLRGLPAPHRHGVALRIDVEGDAGLLQRSADAADVLRVEADVERFELRAAQVVAADADGARTRSSRSGRGRPGGARPARARLFHSRSSCSSPNIQSPGHANRLTCDIRPRTLRGNCASMQRRHTQ